MKFLIILSILLIFCSCNKQKNLTIQDYLDSANNVIKDDPGNYEVKAMKYYDSAIKLDSNFRPAYMYKISILEHKNKFRDLINLLKLMEKRNIYEQFRVWYIGMIYEYLNQPDSANIYYDKCYKYLLLQDTNDCRIKLNLAFCEKLYFDKSVSTDPKCKVDQITINELKKNKKDFIQDYFKQFNRIDTLLH